MSRKHHSDRGVFGGHHFILLPVIFSVIIIGACCLYIFLAGSTILALGNMFFSDTKMNFSEEYNNIFVPVAESEVSGEESKQETVPISKIKYPKTGDQFGELIIEDCQIEDKLFFGDGNVQLSNGVGIYNGSFIPGYGRTILIAGHNNTYFNGLKYAEKGMKVKIRTSYGNYTYEITDIEVKKATDGSAYDLEAQHENLIMYTCYPFDELGLTPWRCFVYGKLVSGPIIDKNS